MKKLLTLFMLFASCSCYGQVITTYAGSSIPPEVGGFSGDGGSATSALLNTPVGVCGDLSGNIYIGDDHNSCVRKVSPIGIITTFAGIGDSPDFSGDGGPASVALLSFPNGVWADGSGNIYIVDHFNNRIRIVNPSGIITTIAGIGAEGFSGDGGPATAAKLNLPCFIYPDGSGNIYFSDTYNNCVRKINSSGIITTYAGMGGSFGFSGDGGPATDAKLNNAGGICIDGSGNVYIADINNNRIRKVTPAGIISTFAGGGATLGDDGPATAAQLDIPGGLRIDATGNIYIADQGNNRVRMVNPAGIITTIAGTGVAGFSGDGGPPTAAQIYNPIDIYLDGAGSLYISDLGNNRVRKICMPPALATISGATSVVCVAASITLSASLSGGTWSAVTGHASVAPGGIVTGVSGGVDTIKYTLTNSCYFTSAVYPVTINPLPVAGSISGADTVCTGATITLTSSVAGGAWSAAAPYATVGSATGVVTGVGAGTALISYSATNSCGTATTMQTVNVITVPAVPAISGPTVICADAPITLTDTLPGGVWSSTSLAVGVGSATGIVNGVTVGTAVISYTASFACGPSSATYTVTVMPVPSVAAISGHSALCIDSTITLTDSVTGGMWSKSAGTALSIGTATGIVTGLSAGIDTIWYSLANACGTGNAYKTIHVVNCDTTAGVAPVMADRAGITVMPNPNNGTFTVNVTETINEPVQLIITNLVGQKIDEITTTTNKETPINLTAPPGVYFITAITQQTIQTTKMVIR